MGPFPVRQQLVEQVYKFQDDQEEEEWTRQARPWPCQVHPLYQLQQSLSQGQSYPQVCDSEHRLKLLPSGISPRPQSTRFMSFLSSTRSCTTVCRALFTPRWSETDPEKPERTGHLLPDIL